MFNSKSKTIMKKTYMTPILKMEDAMPANLLCESFTSNVGLEDGGGSNGDARTQEWNIWGEE